MSTFGRQVEFHPSSQEQVDWQFMNVPDPVDLQTGAYSTSTKVVFGTDSAAEPDWFSRFMVYATRRAPGVSWVLYPPAIVEPNPFSVPDPYFFSRADAHRQLKEIRQRATEAYASDKEIDPVPESAYNDALSLFEMLFARDIPMPDIGWAEDGSLGLEWRPAGGIATMGLYGDNLVIYTAFFGENRQVEGVCALSDSAMLMGFLMMLYPPLIGT